MAEVVLDKIEAFIRKHHVMTVATVGGDGEPWVAHVFYAWSKELRCFVFMSNPDTRHTGEMIENSRVAAAIALETKVVGRLQGLQIEGEVSRAGEDDKDFAAIRHEYLRRFPYAVAIEQQLWRLDPTLIKLTDNTLGFGKKRIWTRS
jgi:uncharacterized protein YhbP (UPF0306 family)